MGEVLTLLYHRVADLEYDKNLLAVIPSNFYSQMSYLKKNYQIVRFEQNWNELKEDAVCITFDDGYMDNFTNALPILEELDIPATIFVSTGNINTPEEFWWDELERILLDERRKYESFFRLDDDIFSCEWSTESYSDREELYDTLHWLMYDKITVSKRKDWIEQLRVWSKAGNAGRRENRAVQMEEININSPLLTIGAHTVNHPSLRSLARQDQYYEISQSIKELESILNYKVSFFSYPFGGKNDYDETTIDLCKKENIRKAASNFPGLWSNQCDDYQIPRNIVRNWNVEEFAQKLDGFWKQR
ncbi:polysaccharide deacetylase family protein [Lachnospiraceae bacterium 62-26]|jgi:peptidoglycan/xylan/chitin deacetylase (PgdA/CDA1 family)